MGDEVVARANSLEHSRTVDVLTLYLMDMAGEVSNRWNPVVVFRLQDNGRVDVQPVSAGYPVEDWLTVCDPATHEYIEAKDGKTFMEALRNQDMFYSQFVEGEP